MCHSVSCAILMADQQEMNIFVPHFNNIYSLEREKSELHSKYLMNCTFDTALARGSGSDWKIGG